MVPFCMCNARPWGDAAAAAEGGRKPAAAEKSRDEKEKAFGVLKREAAKLAGCWTAAKPKVRGFPVSIKFSSSFFAVFSASHRAPLALPLRRRQGSSRNDNCATYAILAAEKEKLFVLRGRTWINTNHEKRKCGKDRNK